MGDCKDKREHAWKPVWGGSVRRCKRCNKKEWHHYCSGAYLSCAPGEIGRVHPMSAEQAGWTRDEGTIANWNERQEGVGHPIREFGYPDVTVEELDPDNQDSEVDPDDA